MPPTTQLPVNSFYIWIPVIAALGGGLVSGIILLINNWINKRSEERKHLNQMMLHAALENWKQACTFALETSKISGRGAAVLPLETHIIYVMKLTDVLFNEKVTKENVIQKLKEVREVCDEVSKFIISEEKKETKESN